LTKGIDLLAATTEDCEFTFLGSNTLVDVGYCVVFPYGFDTAGFLFHHFFDYLEVLFGVGYKYEDIEPSHWIGVW